jgi:SAM-dependent methyltransferase
MANEEQWRRWNGDTAERWLAERDRHAAVRERLLPHLWRAAAIEPGQRILDIGCGCGDTTLAAARHAGPAGEATGVDISAPLLDEARHAVAGAHLANACFVRADAQVHPLPAGRYDVAISSFGVMFFDDPVAAFLNIRRALRPGGRIAFLCWQNHLRNEVFAIPLRALATHHQPLDAIDDPFADPTRLHAILTAAGYTGTRVEEVHEPARLGADVADVMAYVRSTSLVRGLLAGVDDAVAERVLATATDAFTTRQQPDGVWVKAAAYVVTASHPTDA